MLRNEIESRVLNLLRDILKKEDIPMDMPLLGKPGIMDSVTVVRFIRQIEQEFGIRFDDDDLDLDSLANMRTVADLIENYHGKV